jgi:hypothetical protein
MSDSSWNILLPKILEKSMLTPISWVQVILQNTTLNYLPSDDQYVSSPILVDELSNQSLYI